MYLLQHFLQMFLFRASLGASMDVGRFCMNFGGSCVVSDQSGAELPSEEGCGHQN